jgi:hypothetical protein
MRRLHDEERLEILRHHGCRHAGYFDEEDDDEMMKNSERYKWLTITTVHQVDEEEDDRQPYEQLL